jgi:hypothetical protein
LTGAADVAAVATIGRIRLQVDASLVAGIDAASAFPRDADLSRTAGLIAVATVRRVGLGIDAGLVADQQQLVAPLHAFALGAKATTGLVAAAAVQRVRLRVDACISAGGLSLFAHEAALAHDTGSAAGAGVVAGATVRLRGVRVDAEIIADHVGIRTLRPAHSIDTEFIGRTFESTLTTIFEAGGRVDAESFTQDLETWAVDDTRAFLADLIVEAGLTAGTTVQGVQIRADANTIAGDLIGNGTGRLISGLGEIRTLFPAANHRYRREQEEPQLFWK